MASKYTMKKTRHAEPTLRVLRGKTDLGLIRDRGEYDGASGYGGWWCVYGDLVTGPHKTAESAADSLAQTYDDMANSIVIL